MFGTIFKVSLIRNARDPIALVMQLLFPVAVILVLGTALSGTDDVLDEPVKTAVANEDDGTQGERVVEFLGSEEMADYIAVAEFDRREEAERAIREERMETALHIPSGFSAAVEFGERAGGAGQAAEPGEGAPGEPTPGHAAEPGDPAAPGEGAEAADPAAPGEAPGEATLAVIQGPDVEIAGAVLRSIVENYLSGMNAVLAVMEAGAFGEAFDGLESAIGLDPTEQEDIDAAGWESMEREEIAERLEEHFRDEAEGDREGYKPVLADITDAGADREPGRMIDYYAVTMLVMFSIFGALFASFGIHEQYLSGAGIRIRCAPVRPGVAVTGVSASAFVTTLAAGAFVVVVGALLLGVNWGENYLLIGTVLVALALFAAGFGVFVVGLFRDERITQIVIQFVAFVGAFFTGSFVRLPGDLLLFDVVARVFPHKYALDALFNAVYGGPAVVTLGNAAGLAAVALALGFVGTKLLSRENRS